MSEMNGRLRIELTNNDQRYTYNYAIDEREISDAIASWRLREEAQMRADVGFPGFALSMVQERINNADRLCAIVGKMADRSFRSMLIELGKKAP